jgi:hypothetical protein
MPQPNDQPEIAGPGTPDPDRPEDNLYQPGEGVPPDNAEDAEGVGAKVIGGLRDRRPD